MVVQGESLLKCSSTSSYNEERLPVENGDTETVSSEKPSLITESHLTRTKLQNGAESINSNNGVISQPVANGINTTAEGTTSMETAEAF
ncbi:uncharacterized protein Pyn_35202 [Prunus yedoensis var. nudiflora]|uniref:Uncharacterized protein n=1 Tax=Prunus yedoensis var. nudiflora TaxID=2094558 RepID=A0A314XPL6_PRUYE|nr:uncharacterized protein Pyn_35202 [Prunus yedoensis var. nudiflora]